MGVILYVMVTGTLPFDEPNLPKLFEMIHRANFDIPPYLSPSIIDLIRKILEPNPKKRISVAGIKSHSWFVANGEDKSGLMATIQNRRPSQLSKQLTFPSTSDRDQITTTILTALRELSFAAVASGASKIKGHKITRRGVIGIIVTISMRDSGSFSIEIRKGRGDIMEYSEELKQVLSKINKIL